MCVHRQSDHRDRSYQKADSNAKKKWLRRIEQQAGAVTWFAMSGMCIQDSCNTESSDAGSEHRVAFHYFA
jgi:hypothetical protein